MKVLFVSSSLQMGGIERSSSILANEFSKRGLEVNYFSIFNSFHFFSLDEKINLHEPAPRRSQRINLVIAPLRIRQVVKKIKPDTILAFNKFNGALSLLALCGLNYPVFISERSSPFYQFPFHIEIFNKVIYSFFKPEGIISQTKFASDIQQKFYYKGTRFKVINNAVRDVIIYDCQRKKQILAVGRFNDYLKGFDRLIKVFSLLKNKEWILVFAGGDQISGFELFEQAKSLGVQDRILFLGKVNEMDKVYSEAGIFVLPSRSEGFPNALIEAMAAGLPCVGFNFSPGICEIIEDGFNGKLVEDGNIIALAEMLDNLIENDSERQRLGNNAKLISVRLSVEKIATDYLDFILPDWPK